MFQSVKIGPYVAKNRIAMAPLTRGRSGYDQVPKPWNVDHYAQRASAGLLITEGTIVSKQGMGWAGAPALYNDEHVVGWKKVTEAVHAKGGLIFTQLWHMGRAAHSSFHGLVPVAPSAIAIEGNNVHDVNGKGCDGEVPKELELSEIAQIVEEFKQAAAKAREAGFDGVEIHSANGYILDEFLQSCSNKRNDAYGGSVENRFRLLKEVIEAVSTVLPANQIGVRLSPNGVYNFMGSEDNTETFSYVLSQLDKYNLAYVHLLDGLALGFHNKCAVFTLKDARAVYHGTIIGNCGYTKETADAAFAAGDADLIAFGKSYITNPDLAERFQNNWPVVECPFDIPMWYGHPSREDQTKGYTDHPAYKPESH